MMQKKNKSEIRLAKFLSEAGVASRRKAELIIRAGRVKIGGHIVKDVGTNVDERADDIEVDGKLMQPNNKIYYLLNKPRGYICSVSDKHNPQTVLSLIPRLPKVFPVGRLDKDSQGLLLLTNDGDLAYKLTHPKFSIQKTYIVRIDRPFTEEMASTLRRGIRLTEGLAKADDVVNQGNGHIMIILHQGYNRQIRRMLDYLGCNVLSLTRIREGKLALGELALGKYSVVSKEDIE